MIASTARLSGSLVRPASLPLVFFLLSLAASDLSSAAAACTGCAKPSFGPSALPFPSYRVAAVGDFNGDGISDVATSAFSNQPANATVTLSVFLGTGAGAMALASTVDVADVYDLAIAADDFDRDGKLDLVVVKREYSGQVLTGTILFYRGNGAGGLAPAVTVASGFTPGPFTVLHADGDGILDIAVGSLDQILVYKGVGDGTFRAPTTVPHPGWIVAIKAGDVDADGKPDLVVADQSRLSVLRNSAAGFVTVFESLDAPLSAEGLALADVDGDGALDILIGGATNGLGVLYGWGDGAFGPTTWVTPGFLAAGAVGDFNGDGRADVVAYDGTVWAVFLSDAFGFLQEADPIRPLGVSLVGDFDGDGRLDLAGPSVLYLGNGDGSFVTPRYLATGYASRLTVLDLDKDGKPDLAWMSPNTAFGAMLGDGAGGFGAAVTTAFPVPYFDGVFAEVTGDGVPDAVVTASAFPPATLYVLPGDGTGRFGVPIVTTFGFQAQIFRPAVADFDGDGHADVAFRLNDQLVVLFGDGTGHFPRSKPPIPAPFGDLSVSDLNGDGKPDLVLVSPGGDIGDSLVTLLNDGTGGFSTGVDLAFSPSLYAPSIRVIDADRDGKPDLLATSYGVVTYRKGDGAGGFGSPVDTPVTDAWLLVAADLDGDGNVDVLTGSNSTSVLKGRGDGRFDLTGTYPFPFGLVTAVDVTGDGKPDVLGSFNDQTWLVPNTTCVARRLQLDPWPLSCGTAGVPFAPQPTVRVFDDAGNPLLCEAGTVVASLVPGSGAPGAILGGTTSVALASGAAHFTDLSVDRGGGGYRVRFDLAGARPAATQAFSQSLPAPAITGPTLTCSGAPARFEGTAADAWTWTLDGTVVGSARVLTLPAIAAGPHTLALAIRSGSCGASASVPLSVAAAIPAPAASSNSPVPFGGTLQLNASTVPGATYRWSGPNGYSSNAQNPAIPLAKDANGGRYTVVATVGTCDSPAAATDVVVATPSCASCPKPSFSPAVRAVPVPAGFQSIALADFDGDGIADLLAAQNDTIGTHGTLAFLKGDGLGGFAAAVSSAASFPAGPELAAADLDGNGLPDAVGAWDGVYVSLQTAPGRFGTATRIPIGGVSALGLADVNGDGFPDILAAQSGGGGFGFPYLPGRVAVLLGDGAGGFGAPAYVPVELDPSALLARDLNGDGRADLVVANRMSESVSVFFGDGTGAFVLQATLALTGPPVALAMADVTGGPSADLVVGVGGESPAAVLFEGSPSGAFTFGRSMPILIDTKLALVDLNGDGRADLVTLAAGTVHVWLGKGAATFTAPASYPAAGAATGLIVGDFNGDGRADVVVGAGSRVLLLAGDGQGGLPSVPGLRPFSGVPADIQAVDVNADGRPDLVVSGGPYDAEVDVYLAGPVGYSLTATLRPPSPRSLDFELAGDVDGDDVPDVIVIDRMGYVLVYRGLGNGLFAGPVETNVGHPATFLAAGDVDGDGRIDLLFGPSFSYGGPTSVVFGNSASGFGSAMELPAPIWNTTVTIADLDGDGKGDVIARDDSSQAVVVFLWNGTSFAPGIRTPLDASPNSLAVGDFDGDGKKDLVVGVTGQYAGTTPGFRFLRGDGAGGFGVPSSFGTADVFSNLVVSDFNGDGSLDVAAVSNGGSIALYAGDGHGSFPNVAEFTGGGVGTALVATDLDGDAKQDLAFARTNPPGVAFLYNSNCVPSRLGVTANPSCTLAGQPFALEVGVYDDGGNVVSCGTGDITAQLVAGTGAAGAVLSGTMSVAASAGVAHFGDLALDRDGRGYGIEFSHPLASSARSAPFSVGAVPAPAITGPSQLCAGASVYSAPAGFDTYTWTVDGTTISSARTLTPAVLAAGSHALGLTVTRDRCAAASTLSISNAPPALTALSPNHGVSQGGTFVTLTAACVAPAATVAFGGVAADPGSVAPPLQVFTGAHAPGAVDAVVTNPDGQAATLAAGYAYECDTKPPSASNNGPICAGSTLTLGAAYFPGASYSWTGPNGFTANTRIVSIPAATPAHSGAYAVTVGNVFGCTLPPATTTAVVNPRPSAAISAPASVFARSTGNAASVPDAGPGASYNWTITNGTGTITSPNTERSITFDAATSGDIDLNVYVSSGTCLNFSTAAIPITPRPTALQVLTPCRLVDTRLPNGPGGGPALAAGVVRNFPLAGRCGLPADALAIAVNTTVTGPTSAGALRVYAGGAPVPGTTNLLFGAGQTRAGSSIVMLGPDGSIDVLSTQASGSVHVIFDVSGYWQ